MSQYDDELAEIEAALDHAWQKCKYGRLHSPAHDLANRIKVIKLILSDKVEKKSCRPTLNIVEKKYILNTAGCLLISAMTEIDKLRQVANAFEQEKTHDPRQVNILKAYEKCNGWPPTLAELRAVFIATFPKGSWTGNFGVTKTLKLLGLPLAPGKRGRPAGSRNEISNRK